MQENNAIFVLDGVQMHVGDHRIILRQPRQLEIVRRKERISAVLFDQLFGNRPRERETIKG